MIKLLRDPLQKIAWSAVEFALPYRCQFCESVEETDRAANPQHAWCRDCEEAMALTDQPQCRLCAAAVGPFSATEDGCVHCRKHAMLFDSATCLGMYEGRLRQTVLSAKWSWSSASILNLSRMLVAYRQQEWTNRQIDCVTVVPQSFRRRLTRHFHAAEIIAVEAGKAMRIPISRALQRTRHPRLQKRVSLADRYRNQRDSMKVVEPQQVKGRNVLIIDDVLTTGATCSEASRVLKQAGATSCHVAVLGRVLSPGP